MLTIRLDNIGKKFGPSWIFRNISHEFHEGGHTAILGANGSGKSTLLKIISGLLLPNEGTVIHTLSGKIISADHIYRDMVFAAPYMDLFEEFTLLEGLAIHRKFKRFSHDLQGEEVIRKLQLEGHEHKRIGSFSSGMKQRLKLGLALLSEAPIVLLDEPFTNLDEKGRQWYHQAIKEHGENRLILVCSNHVQDEFAFCDHQLEL